MLASLRLSGNVQFSMNLLMQLVKSRNEKSQSFNNLTGISPSYCLISVKSIIISLTSATDTAWKLKIGRSTNLLFIILILGW